MGFFSKYFGSREATTVADYEREVRQERQASAQNLKEPRKMGEAEAASASEHSGYLYGASAEKSSAQTTSTAVTISVPFLGASSR